MSTAAEIVALAAHSAGRAAYSEAMCWYRPALGDTAPRAADAFYAWADDVSEADWDAAERAFVEGWQDAAEAI